MKPQHPIRSVIVFILAVILLSGCTQEEYYHTPTGLLYKVISSGKDSMARMGATVKLHFIQKAGDTIFENNYDKMPLYYMVMPGFGNRYNPLEVFDYGMREGDSVVTIQRVDSMMKKHIFDKLPPYLKSDDQWITYMKVEKVFRNDSLLQLDKIAEQQKVDAIQKLSGQKRIEDFLKENNIQATRSDSGAYVQIIREGQGMKIDTGKEVGLKYVFTTLKGKIFDSNKDTSFHRPDTLRFKVGSPYMLRGVDDGLKLLKRGSYARMFLPTMLAFGGHPPHGKLKPYEDVIFEVWVLEVK